MCNKPWLGIRDIFVALPKLGRRADISDYMLLYPLESGIDCGVYAGISEEEIEALVVEINAEALSSRNIQLVGTKEYLQWIKEMIDRE